MNKVSDNDLISSYLKGNEEALESLIERYVKLIYSFVYRYTGDKDVADDLTQEVFVRAWRSIKRPVLSLSKGFDPQKGNFKTWLFAIAKNTSLDFLKKKKAVPFSAFDDAEGNNSVADTLADADPLPSELFERRELAQTFASAMEKLSLSYRMVLFLRYNDHFTFNEIAESMGESENTVKSRHRRGLMLLKKFLTEKQS